MAQDSIIGSLFGLTPEAYQQSQQQQELAQAMAYGKLDPYESARAGFFQAGRGIGRAIGGLIGAEDPQLRMIAQQQEILRNVDPNNPESLAQAARVAASSGNARLAAALSKQASDIAINRASIAQKLRERQALDPIQKLVESGKYSPESISAYRESGNLADLRLVEKPQKDVVEQLIISGKYTPESVAKYKESKNIQDLIPLQKKTVGQEIGEGMAKGFGLLGRAIAPALKEEGKETGKFTAKNYNDLQSSVSAGIESKRNLDLLSSSLENAFTGSFADSKTSVIKALDGLGIPVDKSLLSAASNTELIEAMSTKYIFPLVKNFPGALAVKELDTLKKAAPGSQQQRETIAKLINVLRTSISENEYVYNKAKEYRESKGSHIGFDAPDVRIEYQRKLDRLTKLIDTAVARGNKFTQAEKNEFDSLKAEIGVK